MKTSKDARTIEFRYDRVELGNLQNAWERSYNALIESSEKIKDADSTKDFELFRVKLMLRGMAVEALLKTLAISKGYKLIDNDGKLNQEFKGISHDIVGLAKLFDVVFSKDEEKILRILKDSIETGRYPVPVNETLENRFWFDNYDEQFYQFLEKTIKLITN